MQTAIPGLLALMEWTVAQTASSTLIRSYGTMVLKFQTFGPATFGRIRSTLEFRKSWSPSTCYSYIANRKVSERTWDSVLAKT